ncbi:hypothetical protein EMIT0P258_210023 [Pseudomonas sp. IT-P258]
MVSSFALGQTITVDTSKGKDPSIAHPSSARIETTGRGWIGYTGFGSGACQARFVTSY